MKLKFTELIITLTKEILLKIVEITISKAR